MKVLIIIGFLFAAVGADVVDELSPPFDGYKHFLDCVPVLLSDLAKEYNFEKTYQPFRVHLSDALMKFASCQGLSLRREEE